HLGMAGDQAAAIARRDGLDEEETSILVLAAITHDFGKAHSTKIDHHGRITSAGHAETGVEPARDFLNRIGAPGRYAEKILPLIDRHMCHNPGGDVEISDSAVRRLLRRLDHAGGGPTLQTWARLVEADKAGRGEGARKGRDYVPDWLAVADRLGNESAVNTTMLKGPYLADAGIPRGPLWAHIVAMSTEAQDDGAFTDEAGVKTWLAENQDDLVAEATRRHAEAQAKWLQDKAEKVAAQKERQEAEKAAQQAAAAGAVKPLT
ncbi:MAG TPA: HD domain-containing protein, partial [Arthrobacter sp.]